MGAYAPRPLLGPWLLQEMNVDQLCRSSEALTGCSVSADEEREKSKFLADAMRLAKDITENQTYSSVKPLLNFWAAFSASKEVSPRLLCLSK